MKAFVPKRTNIAIEIKIDISGDTEFVLLIFSCRRSKSKGKQLIHVQILRLQIGFNTNGLIFKK